MSPREKWLSIIVGTVVLLFAAAFFIQQFQEASTRLHGQIAARKKQLQLMKSLAAEFDTSAQRDAWIQSAQPKLANPDTAGVTLLDEVKEIAGRHGVLLENPAIRPTERRPEYISVAVEVESRSAWKSLVAFQYDLQSPARFIALENTNLKIDATDATKMRGRFKISRWFAPQ